MTAKQIKMLMIESDYVGFCFLKVIISLAKQYICNMKAFLEEISKITGLEMGLLNDGYRIVNFSGKAVYVEGIKSILLFDSSQVALKLKKGAIKITGSGIMIKELMQGTILVTGTVTNVEVS